MTRFAAVFLGVSLGMAAVFVAAPAQAQIHWDASAQLGVEKRFLAAKLGGDAGFGPIGELHAHIAVLPFLRAGAYLSHDIMPNPGDVVALQITSAGARIKVTSPVPLDPWRLWAFVGFGYAGVYGPSYHTREDFNGTRQDTLATGAGGGFYEVPFGIGGSYKLRRPWHLTAELGGRFGFGFSGSVFDLKDGRAGFSNNQPPLLLTNPGTPTFGVGLTVGIMLDM